MPIRAFRATLGSMHPTEPFGGWAPPAGTLPPAPAHPANEAPRGVLRRSRTDRVGAGVAGGLGEYFGLDAVIFRVLFATAAFFGGVGVLAYLLAWVTIPDEGTGHAAIDHWIAQLRRRRVPVWLVAGAAALILWGIGFSWWAARPFVAFLLIAAAVAAVILRRRRHPTQPDATPAAGISLTKTDTDPANESAPDWVAQTRQWAAEAKAAGRARRRRARPVLLSTLGTLLVTTAVLVMADAVRGIVVASYFWAALGVIVGGLVAGVVLRRTPWSMTLLLVPAAAGLLAFGGSHASVHDGFGQRLWAPTESIAGQYRLGFGQSVLDLRNLAPITAPRNVDVTLGAGQVRLLLPASMNVTINAHVRLGLITVDSARTAGGYQLDSTILPRAGATGQPLTITVHLSDGEIDIAHSP